MFVAMLVGGANGRAAISTAAGHRISEIDGFNPATVKPLDEFAMLGPEDPARPPRRSPRSGIPCHRRRQQHQRRGARHQPRLPARRGGIETLLDNPMGRATNARHHRATRRDSRERVTE
jgi:hypothetical protein